MNQVFIATIITIAYLAICALTLFVGYLIFYKKQSTKLNTYAGSPFLLDDSHSKNQLRIIKASKETPLTDGERKAYEILSKARGNTSVHLGIREAIGRGSNADFRELIWELKSQASSCPEATIRILGEHVYDVVMTVETI
jgi:hypothetical protein